MKRKKMTLKKETLLRLPGPVLGGSNYLPDVPVAAEQPTSNTGGCTTCLDIGSSPKEISYTIQSP